MNGRGPGKVRHHPLAPYTERRLSVCGTLEAPCSGVTCLFLILGSFKRGHGGKQFLLGTKGDSEGQEHTAHLSSLPESFAKAWAFFVYYYY